jgi:hypothetical protein
MTIKEDNIRKLNKESWLKVAWPTKNNKTKIENSKLA